MKTAIITIGDELLIGQIVDTNATWMAEHLTKAGFEIEEIITIGDDAAQIKNTIGEVFSKVDVVLMTGGLGPTKDDITKKTLCEYFNTKLVFDQSVLDNIHQVIQSSSVLNNLTNGQAYVPEDCTVIQNRVGTAPITWFDRDGKVLVSLPGVPYEMRYNMEQAVIPRLQAHFEADTYIYTVLLVKGYPESALAIYLEDFENNLPEGFGLAYLPSPRLVKLRLFTRGEHRRSEFKKQLATLKQLLGAAVIADKDESIERLLANKLLEKRLTIATAESCTGGNISRLLTSISGSSQYFEGTIVSYSYESKVKVLGVDQDVMNQYGAVSEEVVSQMAAGVQSLLNVDCAIAVSGIAGPTGGTDDKPVGTVWIATRVGEEAVVKCYHFGKYREANVMSASNMAMLQLLEMLG